jgi:FixJ family two-component response regulator
MIAAVPLIHVLDDDAAMRRGLTRLLQSCGWEVRAYDTVSSFRATSAASLPGCLLLDVRLGDESGLDLLDSFARDDSPLGVVVMSGYGDVPSTVRAMRSGAIDVLTKPLGLEQLRTAVARADARSRRAFAHKQEIGLLRERFDHLTRREREVCRLVASGLLNKQIAGELGASEKTIKVHRGRVMAKLQAGSVAELVRMVGHLGTRVA